MADTDNPPGKEDARSPFHAAPHADTLTENKVVLRI